MEEKKERIRESISEILELPKDIVLDLPRVILVGNIELKIENHKGIIEYSKEVVRVKVKNGIIKIIGSNLLLKSIILEEITITGNIFSVNYDNRGV
ncbi:sporulation protein YqfC [Caminicella sporogenes DSM 14501]|uniref:Sporulation protein YqfC n=1 Tax=Caminicella sporogenes DSM 14501 TaxID=1121266 RepID=A0A1M6MBS3_9FIRM|nr:sporulation protein YqfC [Caminicella sporogenes]RKD27614.1 sporulation protein YqfC [Caminicella sporogenes]WIF94799.1 sporulation protein YqfC [Caminicella sporogenes]SHJ80896.1 sporulation protein YqfC [Caminicella sporogenes DSM 14501]